MNDTRGWFNTSDELYHHGVKGQKWGVTRTPEQLGHSPAKAQEGRKKILKSLSASGKNNKKPAKKHDSAVMNSIRRGIEKAWIDHNYKHGKLSRIPNDKLETYVKRLELEKKFKDAHDYVYPSKEAHVKKLIQDIRDQSIKTLVSAHVERRANRIKNTPTNNDMKLHDAKLQREMDDEGKKILNRAKYNAEANKKYGNSDRNDNKNK